jgi:hypothetical protein
MRSDGQDWHSATLSVEEAVDQVEVPGPRIASVNPFSESPGSPYTRRTPDAFKVATTTSATERATITPSIEDLWDELPVGFLPWEEGDDEEYDCKSKPPRPVEAHQVGPATALWPELVPAPAEIVSGFDLLPAVGPGNVMLLDDPRLLMFRRL